MSWKVDYIAKNNDGSFSAHIVNKYECGNWWIAETKEKAENQSSVIVNALNAQENKPETLADKMKIKYPEGQSNMDKFPVEGGKIWDGKEFSDLTLIRPNEVSEEQQNEYAIRLSNYLDKMRERFPNIKVYVPAQPFPLDKPSKEETKPEVMPEIEKLKRIWNERNPQHETNSDTNEDMFWQTVLMVFKDFSQQHYNGMPTDLKTLIAKLKSDYPEDDKMHVVVGLWIGEAQQQIHRYREVLTLCFNGIQHQENPCVDLRNASDKIEQLLNK